MDDVKYDPDKKLLTFSTSKLVPLAYVQERCVDYPYLSWKLRCVADNVAIVDIQGKRQTIRFEIGAGYAVLRQRGEPELAHLVNKKMQPGTLLSVNSLNNIYTIYIIVIIIRNFRNAGFICFLLRKTPARPTSTTK